MASARTFYRTPLMSYARLDDPGSATGSPRAGMDALTPAQASPPGAEQTVAGAGEGAGASGGATGGTFSLMVLDQKGSKYEIDGLRAGSTVGELRDKLVAKTSVARELQRLIFMGRALHDDSATLSSCRLAAGSTLHLFAGRDRPESLAKCLTHLVWECTGVHTCRDSADMDMLSDAACER